MAEQTQTVEFDPETATYDELRAKAAEEEAAAAQNEQGQDNSQGQDTPLRDDKGRFVKQGEQVEEVDEVVYRRVIDIGDGSGIQVFEAPTQAELIEKLATAQENASRKIRELSQKKVEVEQPKTRTPEEEWIRSQDLIAKPTDTYEKMFEETTGMKPSEFRTKMQRVEAFEKAQAEEQAAKDFIAKYPDFYTSPTNAKRIEKYIRTYGLDGTKAESIEQAYLDLNESGLLEVKPEQKEEVQQEVRQQSRIATPEPAPQAKTRVSSGISARRSVAQRSAPEPTEEDLYNMPLDKLRDLARSSETQN